MHEMQLVSLGPWLTQLLIAIFFMSGFVTYYLRVWNDVFQHNTKTHRQQIAGRLYLMALALVVGGILHLAGYVGASNAMMYHNIGLFVLTFPLLDDKINLWEYSERSIALISIWIAHHIGDLTSARFMLSLLGLVVILAAIRRYHEKIRLTYWLALPGAAVLSMLFWLTLPNVSGGMRMSYEVAAEAIIMFVLMAAFTSRYWIQQYYQEQHNEHMAQLANYDALTNAKTYSHYQRDITEMYDESRQTHKPVSLVALDVDHFKLINDKYGHLAGNKVLVGIATTLQDTLLSFDSKPQIYRTGGEEFNIVFPDMAPSDVLPIITNCWEAVRSHPFTYNDDKIKVTISIGVTALNDCDTSIEDAYKRADENLYTSKRNGRDIITVDGVVQRVRADSESETTYAYFTQGIHDLSQPGWPLIRNELLLRQYDHTRGIWVLPNKFDLTANKTISLLREELVNCSCRNVAINLTASQFLNPRIAVDLVGFYQSGDGPDNLTVEIMDIPEVDTVQRISEIYRAGGVRIELDDVGSDNSYELAKDTLNYVDGLKFALQNMRHENSATQLTQRINFWYHTARAAKLAFTIEGLEAKTEVIDMAHQLNGCLAQGYYFGKPQLPLFVNSPETVAR
ncbi:Signal transduction diguanylate cyclase [Secundilactobacillus paracollinoides DSM 15502 = JCM 11969]|nr:Signal transduction diguanylate cyclase [Secundilactobacillus paracollinoides DSM 15502 = JCM 11969]